MLTPKHPDFRFYLSLQRFLNACTIILLSLFTTTVIAQSLTDRAAELGITGLVDSPGSGSGLSTFDFNEDGLDDITISNAFGDILCYQNNGTGFTLMDFGLTVPGLGVMTLWVDYNNDGELDVFISTYQGQLILYKNNGDFIFEEVTAESGLPTYNTTYYGCSFADYDLDGDLDLYTGTYATSISDPFNPIDINHLYQNDGNGFFVDVTVSAQIIQPATLTFQPTWLDYNMDGWPDLYVINDRIPSNLFFKNNGDGTFDEIAEEIDMDFPDQDVMSNSVCDFDFDGDLDVFMTNSGVEADNLRNLFAVNQGGQFFDEQAAQFDIDILVPGWGGVWFDLDNNTTEDLLFVTENEWPIYLFKNVNGEIFEPIHDSIDVASNHPSYCTSKGDFNNDGFADIAVQCRTPNPSYVLMNSGGINNHIKITPHGTVSNIHAIGTWVKVFIDNATYSQYTHCGENYLGQNSQHLIFGLGENTEIDSMQVIYPSRHTDTYYNVIAGTSLYVTEGDTYSANISPDSTTSICAGDSVILDAGEHQTYLWGNGDTTRYSIANLAGIKSVVVTNEFGITASTEIEVIVTPFPQISAIISANLCFGDSTGIIELVNQSGIAADSISWSNGFEGNPNSGITAGSYSYDFTDTNGCQYLGEATLIQPSNLQFLTTSTPETPGNSDGTISVIIFGGTPPYEITIDGQIVSDTISDLAADTYALIIQDANGCETQVSIAVESTLQTRSFDEISFSVFPNPTFNEITIDSQLDYNSINIKDNLGRTVLNYDKDISHEYQLRALPKGYYLLEIKFNDFSNAVIRIIKL